MHTLQGDHHHYYPICKGLNENFNKKTSLKGFVIESEVFTFDLLQILKDRSFLTLTV